MSVTGQKPPLISVITVSFNAVEFIEQTIESVLSQTYPLIEYIIIDGGSTDGTVDIIRQYASRLAYWHSKPDRGLAHAFNLGFAQAQGDWIVYLNTDDFFLENSIIEQMVPHLMLNQEADVVFGRVMSVSRDKHPSPLPLKRIFYGKPWSWHASRWQAVIPHPASFTNRNYFKMAGDFDESLRIVLDYEFYLRARQSLKAVFVPLNMSAMRVGGISGGNQVLRMWREYRQVQQKAGVASVPLIWLNFFWNITLYFLRAFFHRLLDPYSSKITFKFENRMSGDLNKLDQLGLKSWNAKKGT